VTQANDSILVTPGSGATVATHLLGGKEHQAIVVVDGDGHIDGTNPRYRLTVPPQAVGASKVFADLFNATGSGKIIRVLSAFAFPSVDVAVTGTVGVQLALTRTTAVGTGGTAATADGTSLTAAALSKLDTANAALPAGITARAAPTGGATAGAVLSLRHVFTEETNAGTAIAAALGTEFVRNIGAAVLVRENEGLRFVQGTVASVGSVAFEITFETF
jgi:hypothetical protein